MLAVQLNHCHSEATLQSWQSNSEEDGRCSGGCRIDRDERVQDTEEEHGVVKTMHTPQRRLVTSTRSSLPRRETFRRFGSGTLKRLFRIS